MSFRTWTSPPRAPREVTPGEHAGYVALIEAVAKIQDRKPPPEPQRARAR